MLTGSTNRDEAARGKLPGKLAPEWVTVVRDSREQVGLDVSPLAVVTGTLATGDYSVRGLEHHVASELKGNLSDLLCCVGRERDRFDREIQRLLAYPVRALVLCTTWPELEAGNWRGHVTPAAAVGSVIGWMARGIPVCMVGDRQRAGRVIAKLCYTTARRRYREVRAFLATDNVAGHRVAREFTELQ